MDFTITVEEEEELLAAFQDIRMAQVRILFKLYKSADWNWLFQYVVCEYRPWQLTYWTMSLTGAIVAAFVAMVYDIVLTLSEWASFRLLSVRLTNCCDR